MTNRYLLGEDCLTPEAEDRLHEYRMTVEGGAQSWGRNIENYINIVHRNLNDHQGADDIERRVLDAYGNKDEYESIFIPKNCFITDDVDLFTELYRVIRLDFVADFQSGLFFMDLFGGHEMMMEQMYRAKFGYTAEEDKADRYVALGLGFFKSSQSRKVRLGENTPIPSYFTQFKQDILRV